MSDELLKVGMLLIQKNESDQLFADGVEQTLPTTYRIWAVARLATRGSKTTARLISGEDGCMMDATVTFPGHVVREPFKVFALSHSDMRLVYEKLA